jgi:hypothetical protein
VSASQHEGLAHSRAPGRAVPALQFRDDRLFAGKVLIQRRDVDTGTIGNPVGGQSRTAFANEKSSSLA